MASFYLGSTNLPPSPSQYDSCYYDNGKQVASENATDHPGPLLADTLMLGSTKGLQ